MKSLSLHLIVHRSRDCRGGCWQEKVLAAGSCFHHIEGGVQSRVAFAHLQRKIFHNEIPVTRLSVHNINSLCSCHLNHQTDRRHANHIIEQGAQVFVNHCQAASAGKPAGQLRTLHLVEVDVVTVSSGCPMVEPGPGWLWSCKLPVTREPGKLVLPVT